MGQYICIKCRWPYTATRAKANRLCYMCGWIALQEEKRQLQDKEGPYYERWKLGMERWKRDRKASKRSIRST